MTFQKRNKFWRHPNSIAHRFKKGENHWGGHHHTEETKEKIRQQHLGKPLSEAHRQAISRANKGGNSGSFKKGFTPANKGRGQPLEKDIECRICHKVFHYIRARHLRHNGYYCYNQFPKTSVCNDCKYKAISLAQRGKPRPHQSGINAYQWRGGVRKGIDYIRHKIQTIAIYTQYREDCFKRDNYTCQKCGKQGGELHADHYPIPFAVIVEKNKVSTLEEAINCKELWDLNNIRTLCANCHRKTDTWGITREVFKRRNLL